MTVAELIEALKAMPQDAEVVVLCNSRERFVDVRNARLVDDPGQRTPQRVELDY